MAVKRIEHAAPKKQFMTLDEVAAFVRDAMRSGADGSETVAATVSFGQKLQKLSVELDHRSTAPDEPPPVPLDKPRRATS